MTGKVGLAVATFGSSEWEQAGARLYQTIEWSPKARWHHHLDDLAGARNSAARRLVDRGATHVVFVDADDDLAPGYLEAMQQAAERHPGPILAQPATLGVHADGHEDDEPVLIDPPRSLLDRNMFVIGTMIRLDQFHRVGGFRDLPALEDWDMFSRVYADGADIVRVPDAVYRVSVNPAGRNSQDAMGGLSEFSKLYRQIRRDLRRFATDQGRDPSDAYKIVRQN